MRYVVAAFFVAGYGYLMAVLGYSIGDGGGFHRGYHVGYVESSLDGVRTAKPSGPDVGQGAYACGPEPQSNECEAWCA